LNIPLDDQPGLRFFDPFGQPHGAREQHRAAVRHGFQRGVSEVLGDRRQDKHPRRTVQPFLFVPEDRPDKPDPIRHATSGTQFVQARDQPLLVVPCNDQLDIGNLRQCRDQQIQSLLPADPSEEKNSLIRLCALGLGLWADYWIGVASSPLPIARCRLSFFVGR